MVSNNSWIAPEGEAFETVSLTYENEEGDTIYLSETVYEGQTPDAAIMDSAEDVDIQEKEGKYFALGDMKILR
ncbi:hypothetical protein [Methanosarcina mazei]|jgi:hypothetical protein|uniref:Outer membrane lipoprotein receptor n=6 Tax=Methanosarcina mazei TaxID=2209 RepID=A0A0F8H7X9_METMZ|nr:hypothetical protein [Methanosarcina mazei]AAM30719.1 conserved protein [Methanosarcina mazei Go1]AKB39278.1 outer membrane lipoprotein receptor [Methanosarcina mazei WWM610]AKB60266.1 outer membrane lipoprotein receptor [Methanosarcina mazei SarPi]AKB63473.1 outer membrane lipoprotein receptor [Methanosarcina mazei S-6]AKB70174.1 outer membrane lipoprotein receptor [Methanosarcina mazei C16]